MSETVNLPALGESVTEGTVTRWLKEVGEEVAVDEPLVEVSTDKVDTEIPSPVAGVLQEILVQEDETVEVGAPLAKIGDGEGSSDESSDGDDEDAAAEEENKASGASDDESTGDDDTAGEEVSSEQVAAEDQEERGSGDASEVTLPALGESVTEGTVTRWLKEVGDDVEVDEPLLEVSTDKVDTEIPSPVAGKLLEIKVEEDETVEVGAILALVGSGSAGGSSEKTEDKPAEKSEETSEPASEEKPEKTEDKPAEKSEQKAEKTEEKPAKKDEPKADSAEKSSGGAASSDGYVTPLVRRLAHQHGVDLSTLEGTGVGGRIRKQDVLAAVEKQGSASEPAAEEKAAPAASTSAAQAPASSDDPAKRGTTEKAPRIRQVIAKRMRESLDTSTQLTQVHEIDMTRIVALRGKAKSAFEQKNGVKLTYLPFIAQAVAEALKQHPKLNASYNGETSEITYHSSEDLAIAVDTDKGLLVPVISDAGSLNLSGIAGKIADLADRTRTNKISPDELSGGTFSITNIGSVGALFDTPIINQPQVAILGTGTITKRPMVMTDADGNDTIAIRHMMYLCLTYDHRLVDGADAGRFLQTVKARLEEGEFGNELGL
ncbi:2-oxoglutarate dehydrogenase, E2 component, dihydrolipoamide succinyltransferase [Micrococcus terreus]|uniref:2-oxoglutarate dehydrogenase, E2 component, dihydrolipoamide succinyltransferase n=1 Tax=Micrococcus terreus TaxID=574650 RepID=UPI00254BF655|nr:2-oxoglutarate dehydrogenase, E2 component, dihydrolipoamide succinyltransferase [Micrococcus terreus]MDK7700185.1 2-oxoglutarate dehydrogenase, E2 component, dihydrolipoamide succinyltransferase [Micrococcus terreus]WOO98488.1 2-oxoglutarate dehydrogenase, E2 component, dihydrolipoamide succinyltransferase [Micrococcus terreus]